MNKIIIGLLAVAGFNGIGTADPQNEPDAPLRAVAQFSNKGTVLDVIDSSLYTYLKVSSEKGAVWLAAYRNDISKGDAVSYSKGVMMTNFRSKALNRTFDKIIFVDAVVPVRN